MLTTNISEEDRVLREKMQQLEYDFFDIKE
jgi:hypothetical protein